jgi:hypothetical protein
MEQLHLIYRVTNLLNNRFYIGMHSTFNENDGYLGSGKRIKAEVRKYGRESFNKEILEQLPTVEALKLREAELVNEELLADPLCLNLKNGGEGGGKFKDAEHQLKCSKAGASKGGESLSEKRKASAEFDAALRHTQSEAILKNVLENPEAYAKRQRIMTKAAAKSKKRVATFAERGHQQGEKNSQFGTCWVTDGKKPIKIEKDQLYEYLLRGYSRGRNLQTAQTRLSEK